MTKYIAYSLGSSGVEQSPEKACVGGANPSRGTKTIRILYHKACNKFGNLIISVS